MQPAHILEHDHVIQRYIKYMRHLIDKPSVMIWTVSFMQLAHWLTRSLGFSSPIGPSLQYVQVNMV